MKARVAAVVGALAALPAFALATAPAALACNGALIQDANGVRCIESEAPPLRIGVPYVGVQAGPGGPGIVTGPLFPGFQWDVPLA